MATPRIMLISGPNLNLLGQRQPEIYGTETLDEIVTRARAVATALGYEVDHVQSNHEGVLIDTIQQVRLTHQAIVINPAAFTHYSWAIHDALLSFDGPIVELHLSDVDAREEWRQLSVVSPIAAVRISGLGAVGYEQAMEAVHLLLAESPHGSS